MEFTGERLIPGKTDDVLLIEHYQRYIFAKQFVVGKKVIDAACGDGYGSDLLSSLAESVIGIDIDEEAIKTARSKYSQNNLEFRSCNIKNLDIEDSSIDVVVSFETIEHVNEDIQNDFLKEIKRVLKPNGILLMSTPNKAIYTDLFEQHNEFHVKEFYEDEYKVFLERYFSKNVIKKQFQEVFSTIDGTSESGYISSLGDKDNENPKYMISISSDVEIRENFVGITELIETNYYANLLKRVIQLQYEVEERNIHNSNLDKEIISLNEQIRTVQKEVEYWIVNNNKMKLEIVNLNQELNNKIGHIEILLQSERDLKAKEGSLNEALENEKRNRLKCENEINLIKSSRSWKLMRFIWKIAPQDSKRRLVAKIAVKIIKSPIGLARNINRKSIYKFFYYLKEEGVTGVLKRIDNKLLDSNIDKMKMEIELISASKSFEDYNKLIVPYTNSPKVSIIIPVYNQFEYTYHCINSIINNSNGVEYEIIIANDVSTDITTRIDEIIEGITLITNDINLRFLKNCNNAAKYARGEYILFLNNDTQVQENWLLPLVKLIESSNNIGMVGSKLVYPDGRLQEAGGILWRDGSAWNYGNGQEPEKPEFNYVKEVDYISGAAIMIKHSLWEEIGGFDELFMPAYCEDSDIAFEVRKRGYKVMYQPESVVVHFEGVSNGTSVAEGQKSYQIVNQQKFFNKWKDILEKEHFPNGENLYLARDRSRNKKTILVVDHYVPHYDKDAGGKNTYLYLKLYVSMGLNVKFLGDNFYKHEPYTTQLEQLGIEVLYGSDYAANWKTWIQNNGKYIDYTYLNRPHISEKYIDIVKEKTKAKIIYFGHDLHYLREMRQYEIERNDKLLRSSEEWRAREYSLFNKADIVYVVGNYEKEVLEKALPGKVIRNIPTFVYDEFTSKEYNFNARQDLIFVGGFGHKPNEDAVVWFVENIFPIISKALNDIKLYVVGSNPTTKIENLSSDNIIVTGFVSDDELQSLYNNCRMAIAPLRYGAGVKGKVIEAVYNQIPLITTPIGAEGLDIDMEAFIVSEPSEEMAKMILSLYNDEDKLSKLVSNAEMFIKTYFMSSVAREIVSRDINN